MTHAAELQRFVDAQQSVYAEALEELRAGRKRTHWMWFVLPQLRGLGNSPMAERYGLADAAEARAYLAHPVLGPRLLECVRAMLGHRAATANDILGGIDAMKFRSCLTLFMHVAPHVPEFTQALHQFFGGAADQRTLERLRAAHRE
jgi:uncharacterized protein (DUF1810 family)